MTIGIYGGSFDPIHTGHAMVANFVSQCNIVDEVWIMVNRKNPIKKHDTIATEEQRLAMAELIAKKCAKVKVTDIEMKMASPSYTIDTLRKLKEQNPEHDYRIIIGSDSLEKFHLWKESDKILKEFGVIVYPRPGYPLSGKEKEGMIYLTGAPEFGISSSLIREYLTSGWNINFFVPLCVSEYITKNKLYK